jgi:phenylacetate-coenzyme A ligase PaaK-like adenylate-forming protein
VPHDFPALTKTTLMANFDRIVTDAAITRDRIADFLDRSKDPSELYRGRYYVVHTSGTSGEVGYFVCNPAEWTRGTSGMFRANLPGFGKRRLAFIGVTGGHSAGVSYALNARRSVLRRIFDFATFDVNAPLAETLAGLNAFRPTIVLAYPSVLAILAEHQLAGRLRIAPAQPRSSGEVILAADRERIARAFVAPLLEFYVCSEHLLMGLGRPEYDGMYLIEDDLMFELQDDHTLVTNLFNRTMPLIRYRMNDVLVRAEDDAPALPFTKVAVAGRNEHMPRFINQHGDEDFISPHRISAFLVKNVRRSQLKLEDPTHCTLRICLAPDLDAAERTRTLREVQDAFDAILAQKDMRNVTCRIEVVGDLRPDRRTGKFRLIVPADPSGPAACVSARAN